VGITDKEASFHTASISFGLPLSEKPDVVYVLPQPADCSALPEPEKGECEADNAAVEEACPGTAEDPVAEPGFLCVYRASFIPVASVIWNDFTEGLTEDNYLSNSGVTLIFQSPVNTPVMGIGSWAVTAPEA